jgi:CheY-like chemotaxis protein
VTALDALTGENRAFRVIVSDIKMPMLDGIGLYQRLRQDFPQWADRILFVTASAGDEAPFLRMANRPYLTKPLNLSDLIDTVRQLAGPRADRRADTERRRAERRQQGTGIQSERRADLDRRRVERRGRAA